MENGDIDANKCMSLFPSNRLGIFRNALCAQYSITPVLNPIKNQYLFFFFFFFKKKYKME